MEDFIDGPAAMKKEKVINRIRNNPKAVRFEELKNVLTDAGFLERHPKGGTSQYTITWIWIESSC